MNWSRCIVASLSAAPPKKGTVASLAYRLRLLYLDRWNLWSRLTRYRKWRGPHQEQLDGTNNACERAIGWWIKERYRTMRGAPRHAAMYPPKIGEELEGRFLGYSPYLELKSEGNHSMVRTRGTSRDVADELYPQDPRRMAKARLLELQS